MTDEVPELVGVGTVLECPDHGPQLCLGPLFASLPPQGGGPSIPNWDWSAVTGYESLNGTTWGTYEVVGTYDGEAFTLTRAAAPPRDVQPAMVEDLFSTPCPEPPGGWRVLDPSRTTEEAMQATFRRARELDGFGDLWVDQSINPAWEAWESRENDDEETDLLMNDPELLILNVAVTGDVTAAEAALRETWGGSLCVSHAMHTQADLEAARDEACFAPGALEASMGRDRVELRVIYDDGALQSSLDERYGAGVVVVRSALRPYSG